MRIDACFDSHVHWAATGEFAERLHLGLLSSPQAVADLKLERQHSRGEWLLGFGWDESAWQEKPHRKFLDQVFPNIPVVFSRCDGHALWVNSEALKRSGLLSNDNLADPSGGRIERDASGQPTGVLVDKACAPIERLIPQPQTLDTRRHLLKAVQIFNEAGFTHIRDMTCNESQWNEAVKLDASGLLTLAVEQFFWLHERDELPSLLAFIKNARATQSDNLRIKGLKLFLDGALGSNGAWLSRCYHGSDQRGLILWERDALKEVIKQSWQADLHVALHAIGDEASAWLVHLALELKSEGHIGPLHIEHGELMHPDTIEKMKPLNVQCHLQPCQWLSDQRWLKEKVGDLAAFAFPWRRLQEAALPFDFGSDSPIDPPSLSRTLKALRESADAGIPRLLGSPTNYMGHNDLAWAPNSFTLVEEDIPVQVVFRGEHLV